MATVLRSLEHPVVEALGWSLLHFVWQGLLAAGLLALLLISLRRVSSHVRYLVLCGAMGVLGLCPVVTWCRVLSSIEPSPHETVPAPIVAQSESIVRNQPRPEAGGTVDDGGSMLVGQASGPLPPAAATPPNALPPPSIEASAWRVRLRRAAGPALPWLVTGWLLGVLILSARLLAGWRTVQRMKRLATLPASQVWHERLHRLAARMRVSRPVKLVETALVEVPAVIGWLRPMILLPASALAGLEPSQLEALLAHELAHIRRHDYLVNLIQTALETLLFYHPAVWWLSRRIREEREHCCDDLAVEACGNKATYVRALAAMEELRANPALTMAADGGSLLGRIRRLVAPPSDARRSTWGASLIALATIAALGIGTYITSRASADPQPKPDASKTAEWGKAMNGLQSRIVLVAPATDEQKPDVAAAKQTAEFSRPEDVTLIAELKNVGDKAISLQWVRYGDSVTQPWPGKSASEEFAPHLFRCEFFDKEGKPLDLPARKMLDGDVMPTLSSGLAETLEPGKSLVALLRPARWDAVTARKLAAGEFKLRVHYHGPSAGVQREIQRHWPGKPLASVWNGDVASAEVSFRIAGDPAGKSPELVWGKAEKGLQAAVEFRSAAGTPQAQRDNTGNTFPHGSTLRVNLHVKNVSEKEITFWSETWRQDDTVTLIDAAGKETHLTHPWYSGWPRTEHWTLKPGQTAILNCIGIGLAADDEAAKKFEHPIGSIVTGKPGAYRLRYDVRFGGMERKDKDGKKLVPSEGDWTGSLSTGVATINVRARVPEDEMPTFTGRIQFQSPEGQPVEAGLVEVSVQSGWRALVKGQLAANQPFAIPGCREEPLTVYVRSPGYEETRFYDVAVKPSDVTALTLTPAQPVRFRLVTRDAKPVAGAKVRYFNRSKFAASAGPYPTDGTNGPVWATSAADGSVVLDTLQKFDPKDNKLGNNIYHFYVESAGLAPLFIGPIEAGQDLGEIKVGPILEARGEVRGTKAELDNFAAEWDQPEPMKRGNATEEWLYAVSQPLETKREGNKLTFRLTGLRPGKLRIVSNFQPGTKSVSHTYSRRDPGKNDVVFQIDLTDSRNDLVITSQPQTPEKAAVTPPKEGTIRWVDHSAKLVWINLGEADSIKPRMTFEVRGKASEADKNGAPVLKGTIEVTVVRGPHESEARIINEQLNRPLTKGDEIIPVGSSKSEKTEVSLNQPPSDEVEVRFTRLNAEVAKAEYESSLEANRNSAGTVPQSEIVRKRIQLELAELRATRVESRFEGKDTAKLDLAVARKEVEWAKVNYDQQLEASKRTPSSYTAEEMYRAHLAWQRAAAGLRELDAPPRRTDQGAAANGLELFAVEDLIVDTTRVRPRWIEKLPQPKLPSPTPVVVVRGVVPFTKLAEQIARSSGLKLADAENSIELLEFKLERQDGPKEQNQWDQLPWQPVSLQMAIDVLEHVDFGVDPVPASLISSVLTMPLPQLVEDDAQGRADLKRLATHPQLKADAKLKSELRLFRFLDFGVEPGHSYRYRVRLVLRNPSIKPGQNEVIETPWSAPSTIVILAEAKAASDASQKKQQSGPLPSAEVKAADSQAATVTGTVIEPDGKPVAGFDEPSGFKRTSIKLDDVIQRLKAEEKKYEKLEVVVRLDQQPMKVVNRRSGVAETQHRETVRRLLRDQDLSYYIEDTSSLVEETGAKFRLVNEETVQGRWWRRRMETTAPGKEKRTDSALFVLPKSNHRLSPHILAYGRSQLDRPESLSNVLTDDTPGRRKEVEVLGEENIGANRCVKLREHDVSAGGAKFYHLVWLALDKNLLPLRNELRNEDAQAPQPVTVIQAIDLREIQPGIWFPSRIVSHGQRKSATNPGTFELQQYPTQTVERVTLQPQIDLNLFDKLGKPPTQPPPIAP